MRGEARRVMGSSCFPSQFEGSFAEFKERQLVFALTRQLAEAQFVRGDCLVSERLWQEAAAEGMDPDRIITLLYGVHDHGDTAAMDEADRPFREQQRQAARLARSPLRRLARFAQRRTASSRCADAVPHRHALIG